MIVYLGGTAHFYYRKCNTSKEFEDQARFRHFTVEALNRPSASTVLKRPLVVVREERWRWTPMFCYLFSQLFICLRLFYAHRTRRASMAAWGLWGLVSLMKIMFKSFILNTE